MNAFMTPHWCISVLQDYESCPGPCKEKFNESADSEPHIAKFEGEGATNSRAPTNTCDKLIINRYDDPNSRPTEFPASNLCHIQLSDRHGSQFIF